MFVKNVIFDFAGTVADLSPSSGQMLRGFLKEKEGIDVDEKLAARAYDCVDRSLFYSSVKIHKNEQKSEFYKKYNDLILKNLGLFDVVDNSKNQLFEHFLSVKRHWVLKDDVKDTFETLKDMGKSISIVSNFDSKLKDIATRLEISHLIDNMHISQDVGYEKPQVEFYEIFFERYGLNPKECLYVGDSYELDFLPAYQIGLKTLLIDERERFAKKENVISSISQILEKI